MKDWESLEPDVYRLMNKHYTPGRGGRKIRYIVRHHTAGVLTTEQVWNVWQTRQASANYIVEPSGRIGQLVNDWDTSWANANATANAESITIEHSNSAGAAQDWPISDATIEEGAHLAAALCRAYGLGRPEFGKNIKDHKDFWNTSCPYHLARGGKYHQRYMDRAQYWFDQMTKNPAPAPEPTPEEDVMAADLNTRIKVASGEEHRAQDLIKWTDERVYELTRDGGTLDEMRQAQSRIESKLDQLIKKES